MVNSRVDSWSPEYTQLPLRRQRTVTLAELRIGIGMSPGLPFRLERDCTFRSVPVKISQKLPVGNRRFRR
ncbi:hypothetical protein HerbRD11066_19880 [Herbidospora sp. RD11066]